MREFVIGVNNTILYVALASIWLASAAGFFLVGAWQGAVALLGGTLLWCVISGFWFVQSATYEELKKLNAKG